MATRRSTMTERLRIARGQKPSGGAPTSVGRLKGYTDNAQYLQFAALLIAILLGACVVLARDHIIPSNFQADGLFIQRIAQGAAVGDTKYTNVASIYRALGLADNPTGAALGGYLVAVTAIILVWWKRGRRASSWSSVSLLVISLALSAVYLGWYSKDVFVLGVVFIFVLAPPTRFGFLLCMGSCLGYGIIFREYWLIVAVLFGAIRTTSSRLTPARLIAAVLVGTLAASVTVMLATGGRADTFRLGANEFRATLDIGTIITPFISAPEPFGGIANNLLTALALIVPLPVIALGGIYYLLIAGMILLMWVALVWALPTGSDVVASRSVALIVAFVSVQAVFEPDYGSALRHIAPLLPLFLWVSWSGVSPPPTMRVDTRTTTT